MKPQHEDISRSPQDAASAEDDQATEAEKAEPGIWRVENATRASVIIDAADYFAHMQQVMMCANKRILLIGWDFDTRIALGRGRKWWQLFNKEHPPRRLGNFIIWLANRNPDLEVRVLKWNVGALKVLVRGSMMVDMWRWWRHKRIHFKLDGAHPIGCSHHQKIVVIDDTIAVCGGIDMTADRWDTRDHIDDDPRRKQPGGHAYGAWHDMTMMVEGDVVRALEDLGLSRWYTAGGEKLEPVEPQESSAWPEGLRAQFRDVELGIARTRADYDNVPGIREIEHLFVELINRARHFIYAESQYFASRKIADAIGRRMTEDNPPEIVIINPENADGWLERRAMDTARARLVTAIAKCDTKERFGIYLPQTAAGAPIYVHAKLMIVDDEILKIGSANMNNRSLGLDSECDLLLDGARARNGHAHDQISRLRHELLAEHCGLAADAVPGLLEEYGSMHMLIRNHPQPGRSLKRYVVPDLSEMEKTLADNEVLDPETPADMFEPVSKRRGLFRNGLLKRRMRR
ncbi:phospholipase D-like domain-containing protein [Croceicoccus sp. F390]|uniref:Phospholipase D n=1 Tax=Croceicoccus esteveae TaxID=3075597 RepID=A0ABU2ZF16_9SPHN|nr:phospholipase D-like domain-containing protein [Croceicoccus sp. F390]MDT0575186.1 phospholipase D-like domain-containing protein [Croceicoccus sp. F390]